VNALSIAVVGIAFVVVIVAYYLAIKNTLWPDEDDPNHIKRRILEDDQ
jgi:hypothetical protein